MSGKILVTGAGGFVGSAVVRLLVRKIANEGVSMWDGTPITQVIALLRPGGSGSRIAEIQTARSLSVEFGDLTDGATLKQLVASSKLSAVIHCAWENSAYTALPEEEAQRVIDLPLISMLSGLSAAGGGRFIISGSAGVLGAGNVLDEHTSAVPDSAYGINKLREESRLENAGAMHRIPWINLRLFYLFGVFEASRRLLPYLVRCHLRGEMAQLSDGARVRDFSDIEDVAGSYIKALQASPDATNQIYHIGSGHGISIKRFAEVVSNVTGRGDLVRFDATPPEVESKPVVVSNPSRAADMLGWRSPTNIEERIRLAARWHVDNFRKHSDLIASSF